jgi:hypothetical protein
MSLADLPLEEKLKILDAAELKIRLAHPERYADDGGLLCNGTRYREVVTTTEERAPGTMKPCSTLAELQADLGALDLELEGINAKLNSFAANNDNCTRQGAIDAREQWCLVKSRQMVRVMEIDQAIALGGEVRADSLQRVAQRMTAQLEALEKAEALKAEETRRKREAAEEQE